MYFTAMKEEEKCHTTTTTTIITLCHYAMLPLQVQRQKEECCQVSLGLIIAIDDFPLIDIFHF